MVAAERGMTETVTELVKAGADIHMQNKVCYNTMKYAQVSSEYQVYRLVINLHTGWKHCSDLSFRTMWD